ncbi:SAM-dependent methyltransferase [Bradyrhizobium sp. GM24.11]
MEDKNVPSNLHALRQTIGRLPVLGPFARHVYRAVVSRNFSSSQYWEQRYALGGNSGAGSYGRLAQFKAQTINEFVGHRGVQNVIEFGSGDGAQLELARYPAYTGVDISASAIEACRTRFKQDPSKRFLLASTREAQDARAELALSLDVIYHLIEDAVYDEYMTRLIAAAERYVCVYSSNVIKTAPALHVRHRVFTDWMTKKAPAWKLISKVDNPFPEDPGDPHGTSWADFYFFERHPH